MLNSSILNLFKSFKVEHSLTHRRQTHTPSHTNTYTITHQRKQTKHIVCISQFIFVKYSAEFDWNFAEFRNLLLLFVELRQNHKLTLEAILLIISMIISTKHISSGIAQLEFIQEELEWFRVCIQCFFSYLIVYWFFHSLHSVVYGDLSSISLYMWTYLTIKKLSTAFAMLTVCIQCDTIRWD